MYQTRTRRIGGLWNACGKVKTEGHWEFFDHNEVTLHFIAEDMRLDVVIQPDGEFLPDRDPYTEQ